MVLYSDKTLAYTWFAPDFFFHVGEGGHLVSVELQVLSRQGDGPSFCQVPGSRNMLSDHLNDRLCRGTHHGQEQRNGTRWDDNFGGTGPCMSSCR